MKPNRPLTESEKEDLAQLAGPAWDVVQAEALAVERLRPGDLTVSRFLKRWPQHSYGSARAILKKKVDAGELVQVRCRAPGQGGNVLAWRKPSPTK